MSDQTQWPPVPDPVPAGEPDHTVDGVVNFKIEYKDDQYKLQHDRSAEALLVGCNLALMAIQGVIDRQNEYSRMMKDPSKSKKDKQGIRAQLALPRDMQSFFRTRKVLEDMIKSYAIVIKRDLDTPTVEVVEDPTAGQ